MSEKRTERRKVDGEGGVGEERKERKGRRGKEGEERKERRERRGKEGEERIIWSTGEVSERGDKKCEHICYRVIIEKN